MSEEGETEGSKPAVLRALQGAVTAEIDRLAARTLEPGLHLVATPIGNLGDITVRALVTLACADLVYCEDSRVTRTLLAHYQIDRRLSAYHEHNAQAERPRILAALGEGRAVALVSDAGTPLISDPGFKLVRAAVEQGYLVRALPGPSALLAGLAVSTQPTDTVLFAGFLPTRPGARRARLEALAGVPATLVLFEAPGRTQALLAVLAEVLGPEREATVARELTKRFEQVRRAPLGELCQSMQGENLRGEVVIVVGPPLAGEISDAAIITRLGPLLAEMGLSAASREVAEALGIGRARVYDIGLGIKREQSE